MKLLPELVEELEVVEGTLLAADISLTFYFRLMSRKRKLEIKLDKPKMKKLKQSCVSFTPLFLGLVCMYFIKLGRAFFEKLWIP